jgi:hypothetical protein
MNNSGKNEGYQKRQLDGVDFDLAATLPFTFAEDEVGVCASIFERYIQLCMHGRARYTLGEVERSRFVWNGVTNKRTVFLVKTHLFEVSVSRPTGTTSRTKGAKPAVAKKAPPKREKPAGKREKRAVTA